MYKILEMLYSHCEYVHACAGVIIVYVLVHTPSNYSCMKFTGRNDRRYSIVNTKIEILCYILARSAAQ